MSTYYYYSNELYHHGVKGMKWGVRKQRIVSGARSAYKKASPYVNAQIAKRNAKYRDKNGNIRVRKVVGNAAIRTVKAVGAGIGTSAAVGALTVSGHYVTARIVGRVGYTYVKSQEFQKWADIGSVAYTEYQRRKK